MKELVNQIRNNPKAFLRLLGEGLAMAILLYVILFIAYIFQP